MNNVPEFQIPPPPKKNPHAKQNTNAKTETLNEEFTPEEAGVQ